MTVSVGSAVTVSVRVSDMLVPTCAVISWVPTLSVVVKDAVPPTTMGAVPIAIAPS